MIVMSVAHGESYVRRLFERCLPSLLTPGNLHSIAHLKPEFVICTYERDVPLIRHFVDSMPELKSIFGDAIHTQIMSGEFDLAARDSEFKKLVTYMLLCRVVEYAVVKDQPFFMAVPDLIYSDGLVSGCWELHQLTGKVVSVFNGRVRAPEGRGPFTTQELLSTAAKPLGLRDFFFENLEHHWRRWTTTDPRVIPDPTPGKLIYFSDSGTFTFFDTPNPSMGKFTPDDLVFLSEDRRSMGSWDRPWQDYLLKEGRLLVQPNMDMFMSIEPDESAVPSEPPKSMTRKMGWDKVEIARKLKFSDRFGHFCFTSQYVRKQ